MRPTRDQMLMQVAEVIASRGTCRRAFVGAVISRQGRILTTGYNGAPAGMPHCEHSDEEIQATPGYRDVNACTMAVHAEANGIAWAARWGVSLVDAECHVTRSPCMPCAQLLINAGITRVVYAVEYRDIAPLKLLLRAKIEVVHDMSLES